MKYYLTLFIIALSLAAFSQTPTTSEVEQLANSFLHKRNLRQSLQMKSAQKRQVKEIKPVLVNGGVLFYVAETEPAGFIIISNNKQIEPVIAYSEDSEFSYKADSANLLYQLIVSDLTARNGQPDGKTESWDSVLMPEKSASTEIFQQWPPEGETSTGGWVESVWNQNAPYNNSCPLSPDNFERCISGCVPTALAQIIHYWKYFDNWNLDNGNNYYSNGINIDSDSETYDFPDFNELNTTLNTIKSKYNSGVELSETEISDLIFAIGISCETSYSLEFTSTSSNRDSTFLKSLNYKLKSIQPSEYKTINTIISNVINKRPVYLAGENQEYVGHTFICDGYNTDGFFHLNMGWTGWFSESIKTVWFKLPDNIPGGFTHDFYAISDITPMDYSQKLSKETVSFFGNTNTELFDSFIIHADVDSIVAPAGFLLQSTTSEDFANKINHSVSSETTITVKYQSAIPEKMDKRFLTVYFADGTSGFVLLEATSVGIGTIINTGQVSGTWEKSKAPYYILNNIEITDSLIIEPGVKVFFVGDYSIKAESDWQGSSPYIKAVGTENDSIIFNGLDNRDWSGITLTYSEKQNQFEYCAFLNSMKKPDAYGGSAILCQFSGLSIKHSLFFNNKKNWVGSGGTIYIYGDSPQGKFTIEDNTFQQNPNGVISIYQQRHSAVIISKNRFLGNNGLSVWLADNNSENSDFCFFICNNLFANNFGGVFAVSSNNVFVYNNNFLFNSGSPISNVQSSMFCQNNLFNQNESEIIANDELLFRYNVCDYEMEDNYVATAQYVNPPAGYGSFNFVGNENFELTNNSILKDKGNPNHIFNDMDGTRNDIGLLGANGIFISTDYMDFGKMGNENYNQQTTPANKVFLLNNSGKEIEISSLESNNGFEFLLPAGELPDNSVVHGEVKFNTTTSLGSQNDTVYFLCDENTDYIALDYEIMEGINLSGEIDGVLENQNKPFIINGDVIVPQGKTLKIENGNDLLFSSQSRLYNYGNLWIAPGTDTTNITSLNNSWAGILNYGNAFIFNSIIENSSRTGIDGAGGSLLIHNSIIRNHENGLWLIGQSDNCYTRISKTLFTGNSYTSITLSSMNLEFLNCTFAGSGGFQYNSGTQSPKFINCIFESNLPADFPATAKPEFYYSRIDENALLKWGDANCVSQSPMLNAESVPLPGSPCIDKGNPGEYYNDVFASSVVYPCQGSIVNDMGYTGGDYGSAYKLTIDSVSIYSLPEALSSTFIEPYYNNFYYKLLKTNNGSDSIVAFFIKGVASYSEENVDICQGENYLGWTNTGTYQRTLTAVHGNDSIITTNLIVHELPYPDFTSINDTLASINTFTTYQWYDQNGAIEGATSNHYIIEHSGTYYLEVTNENGCTVMSDGVNLIKTEIDEVIQSRYSLAVIPNPNNGKFRLRFENVNIGKYKIQILNENGQTILNKEIHVTAYNHEEEFDLSGLPKGNFFIKVFDGKKSYTKKVILK